MDLIKKKLVSSVDCGLESGEPGHCYLCMFYKLGASPVPALPDFLPGSINALPVDPQDIMPSQKRILKMKSRPLFIIADFN